MIEKLMSRSFRGQLAITSGAVLLSLVVGAIVMVATSPIINKETSIDIAYSMVRTIE